MFPNSIKDNLQTLSTTGDETWIHYFEPVTKIGNKIWLTKYDRRHVLAKGSVKHKEDSLLHILLM